MGYSTDLIAERLEHREVPAEFLNVTFQAA
jgi:hypothetical protein